MKPWWILAAGVLLAAGLAMVGCPGQDGRDGDEEGEGEHGRFPALAAGPGDGTGERKASKRQRNNDDPAHAAIREKLKSIIIPKVTFEDTPLEEAVDFLRLRMVELEPEGDRIRRRVTLELRRSEEPGKNDPSDNPLPEWPPLQIKELVRSDVSAWEILHEIAHETGMKVEITDTGIEIVPRE